MHVLFWFEGATDFNSSTLDVSDKVKETISYFDELISTIYIHKKSNFLNLWTRIQRNENTQIREFIDLNFLKSMYMNV